MTRLRWELARRRERQERDLGAMTDKRRRFLAAQQERLKRQAARRRET